jgi:hypothetical protein
MTKALQEGAISRETYYAFLERGELTIPGRTFEEEQKATEAEEEERMGKESEANAEAMARLQASQDGQEPPNPDEENAV